MTPRTGAELPVRRSPREIGPAARLAGFAAVLAVVFGASFGVGRAVTPDETPPSTTTTTLHEGPHAP